MVAAPEKVAAAAVMVPVSVGDADNTTDPVPVDEVTPVPPEVTASVADRPAAVPVTLMPQVPDAPVPVKVGA